MSRIRDVRLLALVLTPTLACCGEREADRRPTDAEIRAAIDAWAGDVAQASKVLADCLGVASERAPDEREVARAACRREFDERVRLATKRLDALREPPADD